MIDITGLSSIADVTVLLHPCHFIEIKFASEVLHDKWINEISPLQEMGCRVIIMDFDFPVKTSVYPENYDIVQISERIAIHYEECGLSVVRHVGMVNASKKSLPSFILA